MTHLRLLLRSLVYFWRGNAAVLLGVAVGCAVLTGALLVGDSLQGSLRAQSARRLGWVTHSLVVPRFFRESLAHLVAERSGGRTAPVLLLRATVSRKGGGQARAVTILGVESSFFSAPHEIDSAWLSSALAQALGAASGDEITLHLQKPGEIPREAGLGKKEPEARDWTLKVGQVLTPADEGDAFNLRPQLEAPRNLFVPLAALQAQLGLKGQCNAIVADGDGKELQAALEVSLELADWGLVLRSPASRAHNLIAKYDTDGDGRLSYVEWVFTRHKGKEVPRYAHVLENLLAPAHRRVRTEEDLRKGFARAHPYLSLESTQLLLSPAIARSALAAAKDAKIPAAPTIVYLCRLEVGGRKLAGVVAALDPSAAPPLGPFLPKGVKELGAKQIVLLDEGFSTRPAPGARVTLRFKPPESHGPTPDRVETFTLAGLLSLKGDAADPFLTPDFPGITDRDDIGAWDLPFEDEDWKKCIAREYGDDFWKKARGTPKAYITLAAGKRMWGSSRFGELTSIRLAATDAGRYRERLLKRLKPSEGGFVFDNLTKQAHEASGGAIPFGLYFLCFSFFLIVASLLLVVLLYRLNLDRRGSQVGVLLAEGVRIGTVRWLYLAEGGLLALLGVVLGAFLALAYSRLLLQLLAELWPGGALKSFLEPHASTASLASGIAGSLAASLLAIAWSVRVLGQVSPRALLAGQSTDETESTKGGWVAPTLLVVGLVGGIGLIAYGPQVPGAMAQAGTFFGAGALFLTAGLAGVRLLMQMKGGAIGRGVLAVGRMGLRNAARHPMRSLLTVGLLASSAFLLVAVESFRQQARPGDGSIDAPDGGFSLMGESELPIIRDLNSEHGRQEILKKLGDGREEAEALLKKTSIVALRARAGDDASCLNLYKPTAPRVLGVPASLIERGGFTFDDVEGDRKHPWQALQGGARASAPRGSREGIPAFAESNTVTYMLQTQMGGTIEVDDDRGEKATLRIAGLLHNSVFQSGVLVSEENFLKLYPSEEGYRYFLIAPPAGREADVKRILEQGLRDRGMEVSRAADKLASYLAVENTYLTTFQALGGLGLVLGSLGMAVVLLRSVWERRGELALLRALGWRRALVGWLVLAENAGLLLTGLALGTAAALLSIAPQLLSGKGAVPLTNLSLLFAGVLAVALMSSLAATWTVLRAPIVPALRHE